MNIDKSRLELHFFYCVCFLVFCLVLVATDRWTEREKFTEYLTNAATMVSMVLGLVAIFYSFIANDGLSKSLGNISQVSTDVQQSKSEINEFLKLTRRSIEEGEANQQAIREVSAGMNISLTDLYAALKEINTQSEKLHLSVNQLPDKFDQLESSIKETNRKLGEKPASSAPITTKDSNVDVDAFLSVASLSANLFTLACVLAYTQKKELSVEEFCAAAGNSLVSYFNGFRACMNCVGLVDTTLVANTKTTFTIEKIDADLVQKTRAYIDGYLERAYTTRPEIKSIWMKRLAAVEAIFI